MLIAGNNLTDKQRKIVLAAFVHRNTVDKPCKVVSPQPFPQTDSEWIAEHAFHFVKDGSRLMFNRHYAEPAFMAEPDPLVLS